MLEDVHISLEKVIRENEELAAKVKYLEDELSFYRADGIRCSSSTPEMNAP